VWRGGRGGQRSAEATRIPHVRVAVGADVLIQLAAAVLDMPSNIGRRVDAAREGASEKEPCVYALRASTALQRLLSAEGSQMTAGNWSVPETEVMDVIGEAIDGQQVVLATVVAIEGSAYRRPGATMFVAHEGNGVGSITAGCLEDEVLTPALPVLADGTRRIEGFDLTGEDDVWRLGVGCNGVIDILLEPLTESDRPVVDVYDRGEDVAVLTVLDGTGTDLVSVDRAFAFQSD